MRLLSFVFLFTTVFTYNFATALAEKPKAKPVRVALAHSFLQGRSKSSIEIGTDEFKDVMKKSTGLDGDVTISDEYAELADKLNAKKRDFAIFHAYEYGWIKDKYPDLQPLLIASHKVEKAYIIINQKVGAKSIADLRGKKLDLAAGTPDGCRLYLKKLCGEQAKQTPKEFFGGVAKSVSPMEALDQVALGKADVTVIDSFGLDFYEEVKEAVFAKNLKVLSESRAFPPAVLVYKKGGVDEAILKQFRDGLLKAHTIPAGRDAMRSWNIDAFEPVSKDYVNQVADIIKRYPPPSP